MASNVPVGHRSTMCKAEKKSLLKRQLPYLRNTNISHPCVLLINETTWQWNRLTYTVRVTTYYGNSCYTGCAKFYYDELRQL